VDIHVRYTYDVTDYSQHSPGATDKNQENLRQYDARFTVLIAVLMKIQALWNVCVYW
jgi:hypothetical protein